VNRAELIQRLAAHEAAAKALRSALEAEARAELEENRTAPAWTLEDGSRVSVRVSTGGLYVTDEDGFITWVRAHYPDEVVEETVVRFRNDLFRRRLLADLTRKMVDNGGGELPPFLDWEPKGVYRSTSVTIATETKERMATSAKMYALAGLTMPELEG
jgi:hypothetical protein